MAIDSSIALQGKLPQFDNPLQQFAQVAQIQNAQQQNRLAELTYGDKQRETEQTNALNNLYKTSIGADGTIDRNKLVQGAAQGGLGSRIPALQKGFAETDKGIADLAQSKSKTAETDGKLALQRQEAIGNTLGSIAQSPNATPQHVITGIQHLINIGQIAPEMGQKIVAGIPKDPAQLQGWLVQGRDAVMKAADQMKYTTPDANAQLSAQTSRSNNAATVGATVRGQDMSQGTAIRGQDMADGRSREANANGKVPSGYRANADGSLSFIPGGPADPAAKSAGPATEDERKAAGWVSQAENAYKNMRKVMFEKDGTTLSKNVAPGMLENTAMGVGMPQAANTLRSADRQKFVQGASSLSEALLRAATGAGVNESEAKQKIEELTPQYTDKPEVRQQKLDAIPVYLESLKGRAGRALPKGATPAQQVKEAVENGAPDRLVNARPAKVSSAADYAKLPSGTVYTAPDGSMRTKS